MVLTRLLLTLLIAIPTLARASTLVPGGNLANQTWTPAGSPYIVQGDVTILSGATLTMQAGTEVQFASTDALGGGHYPTKIEFIVRGTLSINGTAASPVTLHAQSGADPATWIGLVVETTAASVTLTHMILSHASAGVIVSTALPNVTSLGDVTLVANGRDITSPLNGVAVAMSGRIEAGGFIGGITIPAPATLTLNRISCLQQQGNFTLSAGATYEAMLTSTASYEKLQVLGEVGLAGTLDLDVSTLTASIGDAFMLIDNDGVEPVTGAFAGLAEGAQFAAGGHTFQISYQGGDGNDVVVTVVGTTGVEPPDLPSHSIQVVPNPARRGAQVLFTIPNASLARLSILDASGRLVRRLIDRELSVGPHETTWDGRDENGALTGSGIYFVRLESNGRTLSRHLAKIH
jgi:FlgD Ig-like domain